MIIVDANSCTDSVNIKIKQPPALNLSLQCEGVSLTASVIGGVGNYIYNWFDENNQLIGTDTVINFEEGNYYQFTVMDDNGCQKSDTVFVFASFQANTYLGSAPLNVEFQNTSSDGLYSWDFGDEGTSIEPNPFHNFTEIGGYEVVLTVLMNKMSVNLLLLIPYMFKDLKWRVNCWTGQKCIMSLVLMEMVLMTNLHFWRIMQ